MMIKTCILSKFSAIIINLHSLFVYTKYIIAGVPLPKNVCLFFFYKKIELSKTWSEIITFFLFDRFSKNKSGWSTEGLYCERCATIYSASFRSGRSTETTSYKRNCRNAESASHQKQRLLFVSGTCPRWSCGEFYYVTGDPRYSGNIEWPIPLALPETFCEKTICKGPAYS